MADHIATAAQDFLLCLEVFPAAIGHLTAFPASDYRPKPGRPSGRLPIFRAARDAMGIMDVWRDTVDTFTGAGFDYRTFEPAEGVAGTARSRIASGLRYVEGGKKKYWVTEQKEREEERARSLAREERKRAREYGWNVGPDNDEEEEDDEDELGPLRRPGSSTSRVFRDEEEGRKPGIGLRFTLDPALEDGYAEARCLVYGDYNCPIVNEMPKGTDLSEATGEGPSSMTAHPRRKGKGKARGGKRVPADASKSRANSPPVDVYDEESALLHPPW